MLRLGLTGAMTLARVCHTPFGGAGTPEDELDLTEYAHTELDGQACGFTGNFRPRHNESHDPSVRNSLMFVRHRGIKRKQILIHQVKAVPTRGEKQPCVHLPIESLLALHSICPGIGTVPDVHPLTPEAMGVPVGQPSRGRGRGGRGGARDGWCTNESVVGRAHSG